MKNVVHGIVIATALVASAAQAGVDVQVLGGARTAKLDYDVGNETRSMDVKSTELGAAAHFTLSKVLPIAFGGFVSTNKYDTTPVFQDQLDAASQSSQADFTGLTNLKCDITGMTYGPEVLAWVPIPMFKPFLRASYVMGGYDFNTKFDLDVGSGTTANVKDTLSYKATGYDVGLGFIYSPVPLLGLVVEYNIGSEKLVVTKGKTSSTVGGSTSAADTDLDTLTEADKKKDLGSHAIRLGLSLSI